MHFHLQIPIEEWWQKQPDLHCDPISFVTGETESRAGYSETKSLAGILPPPLWQPWEELGVVGWAKTDLCFSTLQSCFGKVVRAEQI